MKNSTTFISRCSSLILALTVAASSSRSAFAGMEMSAPAAQPLGPAAHEMAGQRPVENWTQLFGRYPDILKPYEFNGEQLSAYLHLLDQVRSLDPELVESIPDASWQRQELEHALAEFADKTLSAASGGSSASPAGFSMDHSGTLDPEQTQNLQALAVVSASVPYLQKSLGLQDAQTTRDIWGGIDKAHDTFSKTYQAFLREQRAKPVSGVGSAGPVASPRGPKPTPEPIILKKPTGTVNDTIEHMISHSYNDAAGRLVEGTDIAEFHVKFIRDYIGFKGMPDSEKHLVLKYYDLADSRVIDVLGEAMKAGIRTTVITDLNQGLIGKFAPGKARDVDFEHAQIKTSEPGKALQRLLAMGFQYGKTGLNSRFTVLSGVPLFKPGPGEKDLMHDKVTVCLGPGGKAYSFSINGTANLGAGEIKSQGPLPDYGGRFNAIYLEKDQGASQVDWDHVQAEIDAYSQREKFAKDIEIADNPDHRPERQAYPDGTYKEIAFTDSIQNTNDRTVARMQEATDSMQPGSKKKLIVEEIVLAHFAWTDKDIVEAIRALMKAQPWVKVYVLIDQQFMYLDSYGVAPLLSGFRIFPPFGRNPLPFSSDLQDRVEAYGYLRLLDGVDKIDAQESFTQIHIMHRKLTMLKTAEFEPSSPEESGRIETVLARAVAEKKIDKILAEAKPENLWTYAWERSFNASKHFQNLESQTEYRFHRGDSVARQIEDGVKLTVKSEPQFALQAVVAIACQFLARFTAHSPYDIDIEGSVQALIEALNKADYDRVLSVMREVAGLSTKLNIRPSDAGKVLARVEQFVGFLRWYADERAKDVSLNRMDLQKAVGIGWALALESRPVNLVLALSDLYYHPNQTPEKRQELMKRAWEEGLHMSIPFPTQTAPPSPTDGQESPAA